MAAVDCPFKLIKLQLARGSLSRIDIYRAHLGEDDNRLARHSIVINLDAFFSRLPFRRFLEERTSNHLAAAYANY